MHATSCEMPFHLTDGTEVLPLSALLNVSNFVNHGRLCHRNQFHLFLTKCPTALNIYSPWIWFRWKTKKRLIWSLPASARATGILTPMLTFNMNVNMKWSRPITTEQLADGFMSFILAGEDAVSMSQRVTVQYGFFPFLLFIPNSLVLIFSFDSNLTVFRYPVVMAIVAKHLAFRCRNEEIS